MSRQPRLTVPGYPHHIIQRGNNRQPIFVDDADRQRLLGDLAEHARNRGVAVHAYVLMSNHLHLLVTPEAADSVPLMMQGVGRAYVRAGMLASAADYPWSSHAHLAGLRHDPLLTPHPLYWQLGNTPFAREQAYVDLVRAGLAPEQHAALGQAAHSGWALGGDDFIADLEKRTARRASRAARGRPVKAEETASN